MTSGRNREQAGVTEAMIAAYGELIFEQSHNMQVRRGDPIRLGDRAGYAANRTGAGLADAELAPRLGLTREQVTVIRNIVERRKLRTHTYYRLNQLGGGRRYRDGENARREAAGDNAALRRAMGYPADRVRDYIEAGWWTNETLTSHLAAHAAARPDAPALDDGARIVTWRELARDVDRTAAGLSALGLGAGDVVAVQLANTIAHVTAFLAIARIRAVMTTIYMPYQAAEMEALLSHARARAFIGQAEIGAFRPLDHALSLTARLPALEHVLSVGERVDGTHPFEDLAAAEAGRAPVPDAPVGADPFLLLYTSGTTASPKGVPLSYQAMLSNARAGTGEHGITAADRILSAAPFGHLFGLYAVHMALVAGATSVLLPVFSPPTLAEALEMRRASILLAAPAHIAAGLASGVLVDRDLSALRLAILSGAQVPPEVARGLDALLATGTVTQLWGMTELQAGLYTRPGDPLDTVAASAGRPSPGTEVRIADETGAPVPAGAEGELQSRGPNHFAGYFDNEAANAAAFTADGWFRTGDLAVQDAAGNVALTGRSKDVINRGGVKYNPLDIERLLDAHPGVAQAAIVPVPDPVLGERACAFVVPAGEPAPDLAELCSYLQSHGVAKLKLPERLELIEAMPLTATRKIIKGRLVVGD